MRPQPLTVPTVQVPGAIDYDAWASEPPSPLSPGGTRKKGRKKGGFTWGGKNSSAAQGVCGNVWAHNDDGWKLMHQFSTGLELDSDSHSEGSPKEAPQSQLHLPSTSLEALEQLRACLHCRRAVEMDIQLEDSDRAKDLGDVLLRLVEGQASLTTAARTEVRSKFAMRLKPAEPPSPKSPKAGEDQVVNLAPSRLIAPEVGQEAIDVAICPLAELQPGNFVETTHINSAWKPPNLALGLAKLAKALEMIGAGGTIVSVKYAALIICPQADALAFQAAHQLACTLAATFMDEHFAEAVRSLPRERPEGLLAALDEYLSSITIVPTVYLANKRATSEGVAEQIADYLLAESLVESMERKLCRQRGLSFSNFDLHGELRARENMKNRRQFFLQVSKFLPLEDAWTVTHRLRQGLEVESHRLDAKPQMPSVSVSALTKVRELMTPTSVALNICCGHADMAAKMVVDQLGKAGLPSIALEDISHALSSVSNKRALDSKSFPFELLEPSMGDEACHVFVLPSVQLPPHNGFIGAFFRFSPSLGFPFAPLELPIRFLFILVGPQSSEAELLSLGHSLAVLSTDEDLMSNLAQVSDNSAFINAIDVRLANLTFIPHAYLTDKKVTSPSSVVNWDSKLPNPEYSGEEQVEPLSPKSHHSKKSDRSPSEQGSPKLQRKNSLGSQSSDTTSISAALSYHSKQQKEKSWKHKFSKCMKRFIGILQKYSVPLVVGVTTALIWSNIDEESYHKYTHGQISDWKLVGHEVSLHFLVNDIFMCFFFGLAIKEVTEAVLPGGSLSPIRRAANPLMATLGGVVGPVVIYYLMVAVMEKAGTFEGTMCVTPSEDGHRRLGGGGGAAPTGPMKECTLSMLLKGWGVPTATDISLAWMFALLIFGAGHPAINVLLLLAIVDDALGMVIIAVFYPNPEKPVEPIFLLLVLLAMVLSLILRKLNLSYWQWWVVIPGPVSWLGLIKAHVHPALALVFVVPFMPASRPRLKKGAMDSGGRLNHISKAIAKVAEMLDTSAAKHKHDGGEEDEKRAAVRKAAEQIMHHAAAPLHAFEHALKLPVDLGMLLFGLANAGVQFGAVGGITVAVITALLVGKTVGIAGFGMLAMSMGFALPTGVTMVDLVSMSALGGVGLTVALFVANEAFVDPNLQGQAKMGAVLSVGCAFFAWAFRVIGYKIRPMPFDSECEVFVTDASLDEDDLEDIENGEWIDDFLVEDIMQIMWTHRQYKLRGMKMPMNRASIRAASKEHSRSSQRDSIGGLRLSASMSSLDFSSPLRRTSSGGAPAEPPTAMEGPYNSEDTSDPRNAIREKRSKSLEIPKSRGSSMIALGAKSGPDEDRTKSSVPQET